MSQACSKLPSVEFWVKHLKTRKQCTLTRVLNSGDTPYQSIPVQQEIQWIGLRENLQESPIFNGKIYGFL
jgi:hypothetical protein